MTKYPKKIDEKMKAYNEKHAQVDNTRSLAVEAVRAAREYAEEQYRKESPKKLEAIESAKIAYLQSVADFASFKNELASLPFEIARETVPTALDSVGPPSIPEIAWTYRQHVESDGNKYMIFPDEVNHAVKEFEVKRFSRV
ncbi:hypothetical protein [Halalkalibacter oceani]|uniref:hypothetical protein n=1 Tax=Halalkalibacter oceani TaxID=1653776 RepID=UPI003396EED6